MCEDILYHKPVYKHEHKRKHEKVDMNVKVHYGVAKWIKLQFLELKSKFEGNHVCWLFKHRTGKPLEDYDSGHSKLIKNGVAFMCLCGTLTSSSHDAILKTFFSGNQQV